MKPCDGKRRFDSYGLAARLAKRSRRHHDTNRDVYRCTHCNGFHIGSIIGKKPRRPRYVEAEA